MTSRCSSPSFRSRWPPAPWRSPDSPSTSAGSCSTSTRTARLGRGSGVSARWVGRDRRSDRWLRQRMDQREHPGPAVPDVPLGDVRLSVRCPCRELRGGAPLHRAVCNGRRSARVRVRLNATPLAQSLDLFATAGRATAHDLKGSVSVAAGRASPCTSTRWSVIRWCRASTCDDSDSRTSLEVRRRSRSSRVAGPPLRPLPQPMRLVLAAASEAPAAARCPASTTQLTSPKEGSCSTVSQAGTSSSFFSSSFCSSVPPSCLHSRRASASPLGSSRAR